MTALLLLVITYIKSAEKHSIPRGPLILSFQFWQNTQQVLKIFAATKTMLKIVWISCHLSCQEMASQEFRTPKNKWTLFVGKLLNSMLLHRTVGQVRKKCLILPFKNQGTFSPFLTSGPPHHPFGPTHKSI